MKISFKELNNILYGPGFLGRISKIIVILLFLMLVLLKIQRYLPQNFPVLVALHSIEDLYVHYLVKQSSIIAGLFSSPLSFSQNHVYLGGNLILTVTPSTDIFNKTLPILILTLVWLLPWKTKFKFSFLFLLILHVLNIFQLTGIVYAFARYPDPAFINSFVNAFVWFIYSLFFFVCVFKNKFWLLRFFSSLQADRAFIKNLFYTLLVIIVYKIFISKLVFDALPMQGYIRAITRLATYFINITGYEASNNEAFILGYNRDLLILKDCLGINMIETYCFFIALTSQSIKGRGLFIVYGIIGINFINILRLVLLFIHVQQHDELLFGINIHEIFKYSTYLLILIAWIFWLERYSDIWPFVLNIKRVLKEKISPKKINLS